MSFYSCKIDFYKKECVLHNLVSLSVYLCCLLFPSWYIYILANRDFSKTSSFLGNVMTKKSNVYDEKVGRHEKRRVNISFFTKNQGFYCANLTFRYQCNIRGHFILILVISI